MDQRAVGYVRVSTASQVSEGISLDEQESSIRRFAEQQGLRLTHVFREEGVSGHSLRRPQLDALREALRRRETDILVVRHIDRLTRRGLDLKELLEELDGLGVRLMTTEDRYGGLVGFDSRRDRAVFEAVITFAEWQRDRLSSATKAAHDALRAQGKAFNRDLYGFDKGEAGVLVPNQKELETLALMAQLDAESMSARQIANRLNSLGLLGKRGAKWHAKTVLGKLRQLDEYKDLYTPVLEALQDS